MRGPTTSMQPAMMAGTMRQAVSRDTVNHVTIQGTSTCAKPAPRLPQPAVVAVAVPTTLDENIEFVQYMVGTKEAPIMLMKKRAVESPCMLVATPDRASGTAHRPRIQAAVDRGPSHSSRDPTMRRDTTVPARPIVFEASMLLWHSASQMQSSALSRTSQPPLVHSPRLTRINGIRGERVNQPMKEMKKESHAQWKARICGRLKDHSFMLVALHSSSTGRS
mmetsp:Transcript_20350/g.60046  ORF Transcript_20350/g.60046 Transcript_20350/m.60046 type:complete len:221 (-) Transcript_20350:128-790(-)